MSNTANKQWINLLANLLDAPVVAPRGKSTRELLGWKTLVPMDNPVITIRERNLGYRFMAAEAAWILSGDNRVSTIGPYSKAISNFSDDGYQFFGAYGPKIKMQMPYVAAALVKDEYSRQAALTIWRESPMPSKDIPCTISLQWMIRDGQLECFANMRSSDAWLGVPYDWFNFSMVSAWLLILLRRIHKPYENVSLGNLHFYAGSQHLYEPEWEAANNIVNGLTSEFDVRPFYLHEFPEPDFLTNHLWDVAERNTPLTSGWLLETLP
ncbi:MAG TPA: thymidylate synthase [Nitrospira sp.]|nr:thymidylate synthase [Nitrospira sp.]